MKLAAIPPEDLALISEAERQELERLFAQTPYGDLTLEQLWQLMDQVWLEMGCDNQHPDPTQLAQYYCHPVWLLNGLFIETHALSLAHRQAIADWIAMQQPITTVLDFGGGTGTLARRIAQTCPAVQVTVYEPHPTRYALQKAAAYPNVRFVATPTSPYDCLVCTDVLEHVTDPVQLLADLVDLVPVGGYLLIANHFYPSIQCHLPCTFHLRHTFDQFTVRMGLQPLTNLCGDYIHVYRKNAADTLDWTQLRALEQRSRRWFWVHECVAWGRRWGHRAQQLVQQPRQTLAKVQAKFGGSRAPDQS